MTFDSVNYALLLFDILYSVSAGILTGFINQVVSIFLYRGRVRLFIKDVLMFFVFSLAVFSFVVSFANYPVLRYYHILAAAVGFFSFNLQFSKAFNGLFSAVEKLIKKYLQGANSRIKQVICLFAQSYGKKRAENKKTEDKILLQKDAVWVYNL
ncbi:MAG: hypothetical protein RR273_00805 [Oscillospiraceae bacterium]